MNEPVCIKKHNIYDVSLKHNKLILVGSPYDSLNITLGGNPPQTISSDHKLFKVYLFSWNTTPIDLSINDYVYSIQPNTYTDLSNKIIFSTLVKNEDNYIKQWIDYHHQLGVDHFVIYDNSQASDADSWCSCETSSNLSHVLKSYIKNDLVTLINWPYPKRIQGGHVVGQVTQQNHCLYNFKESSYIGFFDIDEYLNPLRYHNIPTMIDSLQESGYNPQSHNGLKFKNKFFYNPHNLPSDGSNFFNIYNCDKVTPEGREKNIVNARIAFAMCMHEIDNNKNSFLVSDRDCVMNHYYFLNKKDRGRRLTKLIDKSILKHIIK